MQIKSIKSQFPIFKNKVNGKSLTYLDSSNSSQKPLCVINRLNGFYKDEFSNIGRSIHSLAVNATNRFDETRQSVKDFINAKFKEEIIFTKNATEAINLVASTFGQKNIQEGDEIIITELEHHSNYVPWHFLRENKKAIIKFAPINEDGDITTLGRGGSDTTAVAMATALAADECRIYTDVDGVYTADPRIVENAQRLSSLTYEEMLEMASLGSKVLQTRAVEFAGKYNINLRVLSSFEEGPGTLITNEGEIMEAALISGIAHNSDEAKLTVVGVPDKPGIASTILDPIAAANIEVDMIVQNVGLNNSTDFTFTVHRNDYDKAMSILKETAKDIDATDVTGDNRIVKISVVGVGMRSHAGVASTIFKALADEKINIQMISTSEIKVSVVVDEKYLKPAVRVLHMVFDLGTE